MRKQLVSLTLVGMLLLGFPAHSFAAIPVIDTANINQVIALIGKAVEQIQVLSDQRSLLEQELEPLSGDAIVPHDLINSSNKVNEIMQTAGRIFRGTNGNDAQLITNVVNEYWKNRFPELPPLQNPDDWYKGMQDSLLILHGVQIAQAESNKDTIDAYAKLMKQLEAEEENLGYLLSLPINGNKQGQEILRMIAVSRGTIARIHASIAALDSKQRIETSQAELLRKQHDEVIVEAAQQAEDAALSNLRTRQAYACVDMKFN